MSRYFFFIVMTAIFGLMKLNADSAVNRQNDHGTDYCLVKIFLNTPADLLKLQKYGITVENYQGSFAAGMDLVLNQWELSQLEQTGFNYDVLIEDLRAYYQKNRKVRSPYELRSMIQQTKKDQVTGFKSGSLAGFYTYDEIGTELDSLRLLYPHLITEKRVIGYTHENREIWAVKISDNPDVDEAATEPGVYYDAMHHAREPGAMAVLMYYMYWLLENYDRNPEATYLVNHREIYFVPIVNPDGYVYNQTTAPMGGGMWRKNRRVNAGGCFGVDLNRNYSYGYGQDEGSDTNPCSEVYRGPFAFSEPETQAIQYLVAQICPIIAFSGHTYGEYFLNPYGYTNLVADYDIYAEFASDFSCYNGYLYGITYEMLGYFSSGTTRDYLHSIGTFAWTPEFGPSTPEGGFWPIQELIIPIASENLEPMKYLSWVAGAKADFQNFQILPHRYVIPGDTLNLQISIKNRGLSQAAENVVVEVSTDYDHVIPMVTSVAYHSIPARQIKDNHLQPFQFILTDAARFLDRICLEVIVRQEGVETCRESINLTVGYAREIFSDAAETGSYHWRKSGTAIAWDTTFVDFYDGFHCFSDSRYGNSRNNTDNYFTLVDTISLVDTQNPRLEFWAKWSIQQDEDYAMVEINTGAGVGWTALSGNYTRFISTQPVYTGTQHWIKEEIDLAPYAGKHIQLRFHYHTDGFVPGDGFYFDNFRIIDYRGEPVAVTDTPVSYPEKVYLYQNYPNPFNPATTINYDLTITTRVLIKIYNMNGAEIVTLVQEMQSPGLKSVTWNGKDAMGKTLSSGVYIYQLCAGKEIITKKMLYLK